MPLAIGIRALNKALIATLADVVPLNGWYGSGSVPSGTAFPYGTIGDLNEDHAGMFGRYSSRLQPQLKWFSERAGFVECLEIWEEIAGALDGQRLSMPNHQQIRGTIRLITMYRDPDDIANAVAVYDAQVLRHSA